MGASGPTDSGVDAEGITRETLAWCGMERGVSFYARVQTGARFLRAALLTPFGPHRGKMSVRMGLATCCVPSLRLGVMGPDHIGHLLAKPMAPAPVKPCGEHGDDGDKVLRQFLFRGVG